MIKTMESRNKMNEKQDDTLLSYEALKRRYMAQRKIKTQPRIELDKEYLAFITGDETLANGGRRLTFRLCLDTTHTCEKIMTYYPQGAAAFAWNNLLDALGVSGDDSLVGEICLAYLAVYQNNKGSYRNLYVSRSLSDYEVEHYWEEGESQPDSEILDESEDDEFEDDEE